MGMTFKTGPLQWIQLTSLEIQRLQEFADKNDGEVVLITQPDSLIDSQYACNRKVFFESIPEPPWPENIKHHELKEVPEQAVDITDYDGWL
jgi:hypothetical protein